MAVNTSSTHPIVSGLPRKDKRRVSWGWAIAGLAAVGLFGFYGWERSHTADDLGPLVLGSVTRGDLLETVSATGSVEAQTGAEVHIGSQISGRIKHLYADVGTKVRANQVIAQLDLPDVEATYTQAQAAYQSAESKLVQSQDGLTLGESQTTNAVAAARQSLDSARHTVGSAAAAEKLQAVQTPTDIQKAQATLDAAIAALASSQASYRQTVLGAKLNVANAQESVDQSSATYALNESNYKRQKSLGDQGFIAPIDVDQARQAMTVSQSQLRAAKQQLDLTKQKVDADLKTSQSTVTQAEKTVDSAKAALVAAKSEVYATQARLADLSTAEASARVAEANLNVAIGNLTQNAVNRENITQAVRARKEALDQVTIAKAQWDRTFIRTPISGTVIQLAAQQGETVAAGLAAPTLIVVTDLGKLEVEAYVDETDIGKVRLGQTAQVTVDSFPDRVFDGKVVKIAAGSTIQEGVVTYDVTVAINDPRQVLRPDMTANTTIDTGKQGNALLVPAVAVQATLKGSFVKVIQRKDGHTQIASVPVKTGGTDGVSVEILSGLSVGQQIVLAGGQSKSATPAGGSLFGGAGGRH